MAGELHLQNNFLGHMALPFYVELVVQRESDYLTLTRQVVRCVWLRAKCQQYSRFKPAA